MSAAIDVIPVGEMANRIFRGLCECSDVKPAMPEGSKFMSINDEIM